MKNEKKKIPTLEEKRKMWILFNLSVLVIIPIVEILLMWLKADIILVMSYSVSIIIAIGNMLFLKQLKNNLHTNA